ncbi:hypothetical protein C8J57DRAFT_714227 [Mycena rebaudengoi]|nr:hypothetical protein C8J57DRAFT_714227 [Mycena rebaudengoi]
MAYFEKHWPVTLQNRAKKSMEQIFKDRYLRLRAETPAAPSATSSAKSTTAQPNKKARRAVTPVDDDDGTSDLSASHIDPLQPWLDEYREYLAAQEGVPEGMTTIEWWGVSRSSLPCFTADLAFFLTA